jgi:hypothetical protein
LPVALLGAVDGIAVEKFADGRLHAQCGTAPRTARKASASVGKETRSVQRSAGCGMSFRVASVTMPSMPSLLIQRSRRLNPAENFLVAVPHSTRSPVGRKPFSARTKSRVTPYLPPCMPPALQAMLPPIVQYFLEEGSGG